MSSLAIFQKMPQTADDMAVCARTVKDEMLSGDYSIVEIDLMLNRVEKLVANIRKDAEIQSAITNELEKYPEKTIKLGGCEISKKGMTSYNYDLTGDVELFQMEAKARMLAEEIKDRKIILQKMKAEQVMVTPDGEIVTIYPAEKTVKDSFSIKIL